jgi:hypothetical protein
LNDKPKFFSHFDGYQRRGAGVRDNEYTIQIQKKQDGTVKVGISWPGQSMIVLDASHVTEAARLLTLIAPAKTVVDPLAPYRAMQAQYAAQKGVPSNANLAGGIPTSQWAPKHG